MSTDMEHPAVTIINTRIHSLTMDEVLTRVEAMAAGPASSHVITANVDHLMVVRRDPGLGAIYRSAALVVPDGVPLLWAARFLGTPLRERINGTDLMEFTCALAARRHFSIFLLGAAPGVAADVAGRLRQSFPGLDVRGTYSPALGFESDPGENQRIRSMLLERKPDILFVSLGIPKGVRWIAENQQACGVALAIEVGASFAFISGRLKRAPRWMQKAGLEWFWRLLLEPRRLWKRYLFNDLPFFFHLLNQKIRAPRANRE
jgi:N-acetylglucosaminyldiphosphoundecaprenol N-acetyl-beta-D-mannosaminyltransferase